MKKILTAIIITLLCNIISLNHAFALEKNVNDDKPKKQKKRKKSSKNINGTGTLFMFEEPKATAVTDSVILKDTITTVAIDTMLQSSPVNTENVVSTATDTSSVLINEKAIEEKIADTSKEVTTTNEYYTAEKGETIYSIARKYGMPVANLILYNNLSSTAISEGQKINLKPTIVSNNVTSSAPVASKTGQPTKPTETPNKLPVTELRDNDKKMASGTVLIGCYAASDEDYAKMLSRRLKEKGFSSSYFYIPDYEAEGKKMYRVFAGPYPDLKAARVALTEIQKFRQKAYIFKVR
jgi:LysM repeat protein